MRFIALTQYCDEWVTNHIVEAINIAESTENKLFVLGLPTGGTPMGVYQHLIKAYKTNKVSFKNVITFNMDEYIGLGAKDLQSYASFMQENFFKYIDILPQNVYIPNGLASDMEVGAQRYEEKIAEFGGVDLFFGGIGSDGHIAFNEQDHLCALVLVLKH